MKSNAPILKIEVVEKSFREPTGMLRVLDALSLEVSAGQIVLLEGPSGSGKTTLLQIIGCLLRADGGRVEIGGKELNGATEIARIAARQQHLGFVFQHFHLLDALTAHDNVALGLRLKRQTVDRQKVDEALDALGLSSKAQKRPGQLSGGEKQRVAFARALAGRPSLLLADEPTSQLDSHSAGVVAHLIRSSVQQFGGAALITTHDARLHPVADRILKLTDGRIYE